MAHDSWLYEAAQVNIMSSATRVGLCETRPILCQAQLALQGSVHNLMMWDKKDTNLRCIYVFIQCDTTQKRNLKRMIKYSYLHYATTFTFMSQRISPTVRAHFFFFTFLKTRHEDFFITSLEIWSKKWRLSMYHCHANGESLQV